MRLAREMGMPAGELATRMSHAEFVEHLADYAIEPWGEARGDLRAALVASTVLNVHRPRGRRPVEIADCLLRFETPGRAPQSPRQVVSALERFFDRYERSTGSQDQ